MITFLSTRRAVACAVAIHKALADHAREHPDEEVRVRIGLNVGEVLERGGHPFGAAVNATQRVAAYAKGGQIFVAEPVRHLAGTIPDVTFRDRGRFQLKGFSRALAALRGRLGRARKEKAPPKPKPDRLPGAGDRCSSAGVLSRRRLFLLSPRSSSSAAGPADARSRSRRTRSGSSIPGSGEIVGQVRVGKNPVDIAFGEEPHRLWVANLDVGTISEIDPELQAGSSTPSTRARSRERSPPAERRVWVANQFANGLSRSSIPLPDDVTDDRGALARTEGRRGRLRGGLGSHRTDKTVVRIDPDTAHDPEGSRTATHWRSDRTLSGSHSGTQLTRFDPATRKRAGQPADPSLPREPTRGRRGRHRLGDTHL